MKLKSFFGNTIEETIRLAGQELGPDAMLVNSKRTGAGARHMGLYEVLVCVEATETSHAHELKKDGFLAASLPADKLSQDVSQVKPHDIVGRLASRVTPAALRSEVAKLITVEAELGVTGVRSRVVALVAQIWGGSGMRTPA
ncbi:MAG: hypothetical protein ACLPWF_06720 [Bryobacteraceae bacterium]